MIQPVPAARGRRSASRRRRWLLGIAGPVLSTVAVIVLVRSVDVPATATTFAAAQLGPVVIAVGLVLVQAAVVTLRWHTLLPKRVGSGVAYSRLLRAVFVGYLGNFVLPARMGEIVRAIVVARSERFGLAPILGSIVLERAIDISILAVGAVVAASLLSAPRWIFEVSLVAAALGVLAVVALSAGLVDRLAGPLAGPGRLRIIGLLGRALRDVAAGASVMGRGAPVMAAIGLTVVTWLIEGTVYWLLAAALGIPVPPPVAMLVAAGTVLATAVPSAPAYVGTFELAATTLAAAFGVPPAQALAWALLAHAVTIVPLAVGGLVSVLSLDASLSQLLREARQSAKP